MLEAKKAERAELYKDHNTQVFLSKFLSGEVTELKSAYDSKLGYRYPLVEAIVGEASSAESFLNRLYEAGVLERKLYDKIVHCPKCGSANVSVHYCCPYCNSFNVEKSALVEHVKCGYMDVEENFRKGDKLVCPKCNEALKKLDVDYRKAGVWCDCKNCGKSFDIPVTSHFCRDCQANFTFGDAVIKDVYTYSLKAEVREEAAPGWVIIVPIIDFLRENRFGVESPAFLKGKSGANHMFDIAAFKGGAKRSTTVIDLTTSIGNTVSEQPIIAMFAKIYDVSPDNAYLIAIPKLSEDGRKMAGMYKIQVIEAKDQEEAIRALENKLLNKRSDK
jgi:transcription elongation factor Elf1